MNVLIVGAGGREHALAWRVARDGHSVKVAPGNAGTARFGNLPLDPGDAAAVLAACREEKINFVIVGPEAPLVGGLADALRGAGIPVFGPGRAGARLEGSKIFCKEFFLRHGLPTAPARSFTDLSAAEKFVARNDFGWPLVIKADGLAAGKGVVLAADEAGARATLRDFLGGAALGGAGRRLLIEKCLAGPELSVLAVTDGRALAILPPGRDHKRIGDHDRGPNTGGMGVVSPAPEATPALLARIRDEILRPTLAGLASDGVDYRGVLFAGLMLTPEGPRLLEYNCRFGDPETEAVLPRLAGDFTGLLHSAALGALRPERVWVRGAATCCVVLAAAGYPGTPRAGDEIFGLAAAERLATVFHAGTALRGGRVVTSGGRVLAVVGEGAGPGAARARAYEAAAMIRFTGMQYRRDLGAAP